MSPGDAAGAAPRSWRERLAAAGALAALVVVALYFPERTDGSGSVLGGLFAFGAAMVGLAAVERVRPLPDRAAAERLRLVAWSLLLGCVLGAANLAANYAIASLDAGIRDEMVRQWAEFSAWSIVFTGPLLEELGYRLLLMGGTAWLVSRLTTDRRIIFVTALAVSSIPFGVAHVLPSSRPTVGLVHALAVAFKSGAAGVLLGWVFWRWGLPYSIICHCMANAVHLVAWPAIF